MQIELNKLTDLEKLNLINTIWESIKDKDNSIPVNESHLQILLERAESEGKIIAWDEVKKKISTLIE